MSKAKQKRTKSKRRPKYLNDKRYTAIHEAGHAIIARVLGFHCGSVTILMNEEEGEAGHAIIEQPVEAISRWERQGRYREQRTAYVGYIISMMAGAAGEDRKGKGAVGGLQLGYNYQTGNIVWGIEGDISGAGLGTAISDNAFKTDLLASIRGRLGIAFDRTLVYATGGWAHVAGQLSSSSQGFSNPFKFRKNRPVVGGGIAYAATPNLIYRIEFLDYLGSQNIVDPGGDGNKLKDVQVLRIGFDYKFDSWGKGPVVAKY